MTISVPYSPGLAPLAAVAVFMGSVVLLSLLAAAPSAPVRRFAWAVGVVGVLALATISVICTACQNCDPWWLEHFWICIPR